MADSKEAAAKAAHPESGGHGVGRYVAVWAALIAFTLITVVTGKMDFGGANIYIAMGIAVIKASLVVLFFMHLWDESGVNRVIFVSSVIFVLVLILGVFGDLVFRLPFSLPNNGPIHDGPSHHSAAASAHSE